MLAKGNRSRIVRDSCKEHGGFYLGSIGGVAAKLALESIKKIAFKPGDVPDFALECEPVFDVLEPFYAEPPVLLIFYPVLFYLALVTSVGLDP